MNKRRTAKYIHLVLLMIVFASCNAIAGDVSARAAFAEDMLPANCLVVASIENPRAFAGDLARLESSLGSTVDSENILARLGGFMGNPAWAGIDTAAPVHIFFMDSKKHAQPWVCQFTVSDPQSLAEVVAPDEFSAHGRIGTWGLAPTAREGVAQWRKARGSGLKFRSTGQIVLRADVTGLMRVYDDEMTRQVDMMKDRMRRALERPEVTAGREQAIAAAQSEMNTVLSILAQVANVELSGRITKRSVVFGMDVMAQSDVPLAGFIKSHPKGSLRILSRCPEDAVAVVMHNLSIRRAMERMLMRFLGMGNALSALTNEDASEGQSIYAMLRADAAGSPIELLHVAVGDAAINALNRWKRFSALEPSGDTFPFRLRLIEDAPEASVDIDLAEIISNDSVPSGAFGHALRWFLGEHPIAAHANVADHGLFMAAGSISQLTGRIARMGGAEFSPIIEDEAFVQSIAAMPQQPNVLVYVSPSGVRGWLSLAGVQLDACPAEALGLCAGAAFSEDGRILGSLVIPREPVEQAIRRQGPASAAILHEAGDLH